MTGDTYLTLSNNGEAVYTEKRSKFYAFAEHVEDEESAKARVAALRKQFYDARHVCFAYALDFDGERTRTNDDGEPSGTAGRPILGALRSAGLTFALVVVVRYFGGVKLGTGGLVVAYREAAAAAIAEATTEEFGGVKLGTGGLVVAYREAAAAAIAEATTEERLVMGRLRVEVPYADADVAMRFIREGGGEITARDFSAEGTTLTVDIRMSLLAPLRERLAKILSLRFLDETDKD